MSLLTPEAVAEKLGVAPKTLANWRSMDTGPKHYKVGRFVRYKEPEVREWLDRHAVLPSR